MTIYGTTKLLGIIGDPVIYSRSPLMHNFALQKLQLDYIYGAFPIAQQNLGKAIEGMWYINSIHGFNVTIPHKEAILPHLSEVTDLAMQVGAVNTVKRGAVGWWGTNTDVYGFTVPLQRLSRSWSDCQVIILGNGGAARAVVVGMYQLDCKHIRAIGRSMDKMQVFQQQMTRNLPDLQLEIYEWGNLQELLPTGELVINTTPIGMPENPKASPLTPEQLQLLPHGSIVYDLIYTPRPTQLLKLAHSAGHTTIDGIEMLLYQGVQALEFWLGVDIQPVIEGMRQILLTKSV
jgi:shikimate dehydrogenase